MMRRLAVAAGLAAALVSGMIGGGAAATASARPEDGCWDPVPCPIRLHDVDMLAVNEGWAVGEGGTILRWNGLRWRPQPSPTTQVLGAVSMVSASDGWAGGGEGTLLRWNGSAWAPQPSPTNHGIYDISMLSATDGWLTTETGIWRWDGAQWTKRSEVGAAKISVLNASAAWAGGGSVLRWDGSQWHPFVDGGMDLEAIKAFAADNVWIGGVNCISASCLAMPNQLVLDRWDGEAWVPMIPFTEGSVNDIDGVAADDVWVVGRLDFPSATAALFHWDGAALETITTQRDLYGVSMVSATDGWAAGEQGTLLRWDGVVWAPYAPAIVNTYVPLLGR